MQHMHLANSNIRKCSTDTQQLPIAGKFIPEIGGTDIADFMPDLGGHEGKCGSRIHPSLPMSTPEFSLVQQKGVKAIG